MLDGGDSIDVDFLGVKVVDEIEEGSVKEVSDDELDESYVRLSLIKGYKAVELDTVKCLEVAPGTGKSSLVDKDIEEVSPDEAGPEMLGAVAELI